MRQADSRVLITVVMIGKDRYRGLGRNKSSRNRLYSIMDVSGQYVVDVSAKLRQMVDNNIPYYIQLQAVVAMYDIVSCANNFTSGSNGNFGPLLEYVVHCFSNDLDVAFNCPSETYVSTKEVISLGSILKERFNLVDSPKDVKQWIFYAVIHK